MTKHFSPELKGTDYILLYDGAIMREDEPGRFVRFPRLKSAEEIR